MNALSTQAAKMKEKKIKKVPKISKLTRTNSSSEALPDARPEQATPTTEAPEGSSESMEGVEGIIVEWYVRMMLIYGESSPVAVFFWIYCHHCALIAVVMIGNVFVASQSHPGHKKKKVSWAGDDSLTKIHYFELDESERGK